MCKKIFLKEKQPPHVPRGNMRRLLAVKYRWICSGAHPYAQLMPVGLGSSMMMSFRKVTALRRPSSMLIRLSSCSMDSTRS